MATKRNQRKARSTAKRVYKKTKKSGGLFLAILVLLLLFVGFYFADKKEIFVTGISKPVDDFISGLLPDNNKTNKPDDNHGNVVIEGDLTICFLELGNKYTGDSVFIKAGDNDILIDAGSRKNSSTAISEFVNQYCTDGTLEYVIATHAHQDHIAGFVGSKSDPGIFSRYECKNIIDFGTSSVTSQLYQDYISERNKEVEAGAVYHNALDCYNESNGATRTIKLTEDIYMEILYNSFYGTNPSNENNNSVCMMLHHGDRKFLFTGDLEKEGEEELVKNNTLGKVDLFKAGHHGSYTASTDAILSVIKPDIVCVCCCAGSDEYTKVNENMFPSQAFCSRICKYTENVYVTSVADESDKGYTSLNGNIFVSSTVAGISVKGSNNDVVLKDTEWFKKNRVWK